MLYVYVVRKDDCYYIRLMKKTGVINESRIGYNIDFAVRYGNELIDALINAGMDVQPSLGLTEEYRGE